jgi:hypothetical protein
MQWKRRGRASKRTYKRVADRGQSKPRTGTALRGCSRAVSGGDFEQVLCGCRAAFQASKWKERDAIVVVSGGDGGGGGRGRAWRSVESPEYRMMHVLLFVYLNRRPIVLLDLLFYYFVEVQSRAVFLHSSTFTMPFWSDIFLSLILQ